MIGNILESISFLSWNEELKKEFIGNFSSQINTLSDWDEKWKNYKTFIENESTLDLFFDNYNFDFILSYVTKYVEDSDANNDRISDVIYKALFDLFNQKDKNEYSEELVLLLDMFWYILKTNFYNVNYNGDNKTYIWLRDNIYFLRIVFVITLSLIENKNYDNIGEVKTECGYLFWDNTNNSENKRIYQYLAFRQIDAKFNEHLLIISLLVIFLEDGEDTIHNLRNISWWVQNYKISQIFWLIDDVTSERYEFYVNIINNSWLLHAFLNKITKKKDWLSWIYLTSILRSIINLKILEGNHMIILHFSDLFISDEEINKEYLGIISWINIMDSKILCQLESKTWANVSTTITFLLIKGGKRYVKESILDKLVEIIKHKLKDNLELDSPYFELYENIIIWEYGKIKLNFKLNDFYDEEDDENKLVAWIIADITLFSVTLKHIKNFLRKNDLDKFYFELIKSYILDKYNISDEFSIVDIRNAFGFTVKDDFVEKELGKLTVPKKYFKSFWKPKTENHIIRLIWKKNYEVL